MVVDASTSFSLAHKPFLLGSLSARVLKKKKRKLAIYNPALLAKDIH